MENGRMYHGYHRGIYMYPCDEVSLSFPNAHSSLTLLRTQAEKDRMDLFHALFLIARRQELHRATIESTEDIRILDLGTGTGIWAIDMAE